MNFKWENLDSEGIEYKEIKQDASEPTRGFCAAHTPDCGAIKEDKNCQCGEPKDSHHSLCTSCHSILPNDLQIDVDWCPEVYQAALQYLND